MELFGLLLSVGLAVAAWSAATKAAARVRVLEGEIARLHERLSGLAYSPPEGGASSIQLDATTTQLDATATQLHASAPAAAPPTPPQVIVHELPLRAEPISRARRKRRQGWTRAELEARLGARLPIWLGAIALVLAVVYLVKWSFDRDLLSPAARVAIGCVFGVGLLGGSEALRARAAGVAQGLCAAGVGALFASFLAAANLYHLVSQTTGFALLAATTALGVVLSLRHGPIVAAIGLIGGFATPALIGSPEPNATALFGYLILLECGLLAVARRRGWGALSGLTGLAALVWPALWTFGVDGEEGRIVVGVFLLATAATFVWSGRPASRAGTADPGGSPAGAVPSVGWRGWMAPLLLLALMGLRLERAEFSALEWSFVGLLGAGTLALARLDPVYDRMAGLAAAWCAALLWVWVVWASPGTPEPGRFGPVVLLLGTLWAGGAFVAHEGAAHPARFAWLSAAAATGFLALAHAGLPAPRVPHAFGIIAAGLAGAYTLAARAALRERQQAREGEGVLAAFATGTAALAALALGFELERGALTAGLALLVLAVAEVHARTGIGALRQVATLAGATVGLRLLANPAVFAYPLSPRPFANGLLSTYGIPAAAFAWTSERFRRSGATREAPPFLAGAIAFAGFGIVLLVRHAFHDGLLDTASTSLAEWGVYVVVGLGYALALERCAREWPRRALSLGWPVVASAALATAVLANCAAANPRWERGEVGARALLNVLLLAYAVPAALAAVAARAAARAERSWLAFGAGATSLLLAFWWVTLEVRRAFHGSDLATGTASHAELYAYSIAWIVLGVALLVLGLRLRSTALRAGSLLVMGISVVKVFFYDTSHLSDLYRVFSFLGLGASLLLLAFLYQRVISPRGDHDAG